MNADLQRVMKAINWLSFEEIIENRRDLAEKIGYTESSLSQILNEKVSLSEKFIKKLANMDDRINDDWLLTGRGEMLKSQTIHNTGTINAQNGSVGQVYGDFHHNGGKDMVIDEQKKEVNKMFEAIMIAVGGFQKASERHDDYVVRQDDYIKRQDDYIAKIINNSYQRNKENMERQDRDRERLDLQLAQQNELIRMVVEQNKRMQDRADKLIELIITKF